MAMLPLHQHKPAYRHILEDGVHPNSWGYGFHSRVIIEAINTKFGSNIPAD